MPNKIKNSIYTCLLLALLTGCDNSNKQDLPLRYRYENIIDISYTPTEKTRGGGWFCDQGSWMGFTIPQKDNWINGFCGPFNLDNRHWLVRSATKVSFNTAGIEVFKPDSINYIPGEIYISARSITGGIKQRLQFVDASTALLSVQADINRELRITGDGWAEGTTFKLNQNTVIAQQPSGEIVCISFAPDAKVNCDSHNYEATCDGEKEFFVAISFFNNEKRRSLSFKKLLLYSVNQQHISKPTTNAGTDIYRKYYAMICHTNTTALR